MHKQILLSIWLSILIITTAKAQRALDNSNQHKIDSLHNEVIKFQLPASKVDIWIYLANSYIDQSQTDSAQYCLEQGFQLISQSPYKLGEYFLLSYQAELLDKNTLYDEALKYSLKSLKLAESIADQELVGYSYVLLGLIYNDSGHPQKAIQYLRKSLNFLPSQSHQKHSVAQRQHSFLNLGQCYFKTKQYSLANYWLKKAIQEANVQYDYRVMSISYWLLGKSFDCLGSYEQAGLQYKSGLRYARMIHDWDAAILFSPQLFHYYYRKNQLRKALAALHSGLQLVEGASGRIAMLPRKDFYVELVAIYQILNDYPKVVNAQRMVLDMSEQINQKVNGQRLFLIQTFSQQENQLLKLDIERKNQEAELKKNRIINAALGILLGLAAVIFGIIYYLLQQRRKYERLQQKQKVADLEQQRVLSTLKAVIEGEERERNRLANELHNGVGSMLVAVRHTLEQHNRAISSLNKPLSITLVDQAYEEVRRIAHNLMPHSLEHMGLPIALEQYCRTVVTSTELKLTLQIYGLEERFEPSLELWVFRIVQELVTNVLKHAKATTALVQLINTNGVLHLTIEDDGHGFVVSKVMQSESFGLRQLTERAAYLKGTVHIESELGVGTTILIELPVQPLTLSIK